MEFGCNLFILQLFENGGDRLYWLIMLRLLVFVCLMLVRLQLNQVWLFS